MTDYHHGIEGDLHKQAVSTDDWTQITHYNDISPQPAQPLQPEPPVAWRDAPIPFRTEAALALGLFIMSVVNALHITLQMAS
jgi:hypothetical protein